MLDAERAVVALALGLALALTALPAAASTWEIDPVHSSAVFKINHFQTANFYGMFHGIKGDHLQEHERQADR